MSIEIKCKASENDRRRAKRSRAVLGGTVRERGRTASSATIHELSPFGCRIESATIMMGGNSVWVRINGLESLVCRITWAKNFSAGISFETPLHPAVARRMAPVAGEENQAIAIAPANDGGPAEIGGHLLSRREQIMQGMADCSLSPLSTRKRPKGATWDSLVRRRFAREVDNRHENRFEELQGDGPVKISVDGCEALIKNLSASGLKIKTDLPAEIGQHLPIEFKGFPPMTGRIVWMGHGMAGISLPPDSIALNAN